MSPNIFIFAHFNWYHTQLFYTMSRDFFKLTNVGFMQRFFVVLLLLVCSMSAAADRGTFENDVEAEFLPDPNDPNNCIIRYYILYHHGLDDSGFRKLEDDGDSYGCRLYLEGVQFLEFWHEDDMGVDFKYTIDDQFTEKTGFEVIEVEPYKNIMVLPRKKHDDNDCDDKHYWYLTVDVKVPFYRLNHDVTISARGVWWRWGDGWNDTPLKGCDTTLKLDYTWKMGKVQDCSFYVNDKGEMFTSWYFSTDNASIITKTSVTTNAAADGKSFSKDYDAGEVPYKKDIEDLYIGKVKTKYSSNKYNITCTWAGQETYTADTITYTLIGTPSSENKTIDYYGFPYVKDAKVNTVFDWEHKSIKLTWNVVGDLTKNYIKNGHWVLKRTQKTKVGDTEKVRTILLEEAIPLTETSYVDYDVQFQSKYSYELYYCHDDWKTDNDVSSNLSGKSAEIATNRSITVDITAEPSENSVALTMVVPVDKNRTDKLYNAVLYRDKQILKEYNNLAKDVDTLYYYDVSSASNPLNYRIGHNYILKVTSNLPVEDKGVVIGEKSTQAAVKGGNRIEDLTVSKGDYTDKVVLNWRNSRPLSDNYYDQYKIYRRLFDAEANAWTEYDSIASMSSKDRFVSYTDVQAKPGEYYEYEVILAYDGTRQNIMSLQGIGFANSYGVVTGNITYQNGTALANALVSLKPAIIEGEFPAVYQRSVNLAGGTLSTAMEADSYKKLVSGDFTVQFWIQPDSKQRGRLHVAQIPGLSKSHLFANVSEKAMTLSLEEGTSVLTLAKDIPNNEWIHVSLVREGGKLNTYINYTDSLEKQVVVNQVYDIATVAISNMKMAFGTAANALVGFAGNMDELQIWQKALSADEVLRYGLMHLSGKEDALICYLPFDEGIPAYAFDHAYNGNSRATNHAVMSLCVRPETNVPARLALCGYTNAQGNYMISGVPYTGNGTVYKIAPAYGNHEFIPASVNRYVSGQSLVHNNVNYVDNSSFIVKGTVTYRYGDFPVEGAALYIDGVQAKKAGEPILTDAEGKYELDMPIGNHYLSVRMENHGFQYEGRFPADGSYYDFQSHMNGINFTDTTLVVVAGRVAGGHDIAQLPLAAGYENGSRANIGQATLYLSPVSNRSYRVNSSETETITMPGDSLSYRVESVTRLLPYERNGSQISQIEIKTDPRTGEFRALLPPLKYNVVYGYTKSYGNDELRAFDASQINPVVGKVLTDSLVVTNVSEKGDTTYTTYRSFFNTKTIIQYDSRPEFALHMFDRTWSNSLGIESVKVGEYNVPTYDDSDNDEIYYTFGYPVFNAGETYTLRLTANQKYYNSDDEEGDPVESIVPLNGATASFIGADWATLATQKEVKIKEGVASYTFVASDPLIDEDKITKNLSIAVNTGNRVYKYPEDGNLEAIIMGFEPEGRVDDMLNTGRMLLVGGPTEVHFVLRDPPGSQSYSTLEEGSTFTTTSTFSSDISDSFNWNVNTFVGLGVKLGWGWGLQAAYKTLTLMTIGVNRVGEKHDHTGNSTTGNVVNGGIVNSFSTTKSISTGADALHVGSSGDVYIGTNSILAIGKGRSFGFHAQKPDNGSSCREYKAYDDKGEEVSVYLYGKPMFGSAVLYDEEENFALDQLTLETQMIPNLKKYRDDLLLPAGTKDSDLNWEAGEHAKFISNYAIDDPRYMVADDAYVIKSNPNIATSNICYVDTIQTVQSWIDGWESIIRKNEQRKVNGKYDQTLAISSGIPYSESIKVSDAFTSESSTTYLKTSSNAFGEKFSTTFGVSVDVNSTLTYSDSESSGTSESESHSNSTKVSYTIKDSDIHDYFSIGVDTTAIMTQGYLFRLKGGASTNPWEGPEYSKYYNPGRGVISEGTLKVDKPKISIKQSTITDIPNGREATVVLQLANASEIHAANSYILRVNEGTNPDGLVITCDGYVLGEAGHKLNFRADESYTKVLKIKQSRLDVMDYKDVTLTFRSPNYKAALESKIPDLNAQAKFSLHFKPSCSDASLEALDTLYNKTLSVNLGTSDQVVLRASNYNTKYNGFYKLVLERKGEFETQWHNIHEWAVNEKLAQENGMLAADTIGNRSSVAYRYDMHDLADQKYMFRVVTHGKYGKEEITFEADTVMITKDVRAPQVMTVTPSDGILTADKEISVLFNEEIFSTGLVSSNMKVTGVLNSQELTHQHGLYFQGSTTSTVHTTADLTLSGDFSVEMWFSSGLTASETTLFTHTLSDKGFRFGFNNRGNLCVSMNGQTFISPVNVQMSRWAYLGVSFNDREKRLRAYIFYTDTKGIAHQTELLDEQVASTYNATGHVYIGEKLEGNMSDVTIWGVARDMTDMADRNKTHTGRELGLLACWPMTEGHGNIAADIARDRHLTLPANSRWFVSDGNYAAHFNGTDSYIKTAAAPIGAAEDFAVEFWFNTQQSDATLLQMGDNIFRVSNGKLVFDAVGKDIIAVGSKAVNDGEWHHAAMNVVRNASVNFYVDGRFCTYTPDTLFKAIDTPYYIIGARESSDNSRKLSKTLENSTLYQDFLKGGIDELRVWHATLNSKALLSNRYCHVDSVALGLMMSYQFDHNEYLTGTERWAVRGDTYDHGPLKLPNTVNGVTVSSAAPSLTGTIPEELVSFDWVASKDKVVISVTEPLYRIENCQLNFSLDRVQDMNGNTILSPVKWSAYVNSNRLKWSQEEYALNAIYDGKGDEATVDITNSGNTVENWTIEGVPSWLKISETSGTMNPMSRKHISFSTVEGIPVGNYEAILHLVGNDGVREPLAVSLSVTGAKPAWNVDPAKFDYTDVLTGRLEIEGYVSEDKNDMVAAFVGDTCVGVAHPMYVESLDNYLVMMTLYSDAKLTGKPVSLKVWRASTGRIYPAVSVFTDKGVAKEVVLTQEGKAYGTPNAAWHLRADNLLQTDIPVTHGWRWITVNVDANAVENSRELSKTLEDSNKNRMIVESLFPGAKLLMVKSQWNTHNWSDSMDKWWGTLKEPLSPTKMYMIYGKRDDVISIIGKPIVPSELPDTIVQGWNWIGYTPLVPMDITTALAGANPIEGDILKGQRTFAYYTQNQWVGTMDYLEPGCGYIYYTKAEGNRLLHFPNEYNIVYRQKAKRQVAKANVVDWNWNPHLFSSNMTVTAHVYYGERQIMNGIVGAFDEQGVCRGYQSIDAESGMLFLVISGDDVCTLTLKLYDAETGEVYSVPAEFTYLSNKMVGNIDEPATLQFDENSTSIDNVNVNDNDNAIYDLSGRKVSVSARSGKALAPGIYITSGKKSLKK